MARFYLLVGIFMTSYGENDHAAVEFERDQMLTRIRKEADTAWAAKDFPLVTDLFEPIRADLTEIERKRLAYAEKHIGNIAQATDGGISRHL
jgi:hypothetical protein